MEIKEDERIDDLELEGMRLIQKKRGFCFGIDSVLLVDFAKDIKKGAKVIDLGTGTGIIPTLLCNKTQVSYILGVEIQKEISEMAKRSIELNQLEKKFEILQEDILNVTSILPKQSFDVVITNPPYQRKDAGLRNQEISNYLSRHETTAQLKDFIEIGNKLLKNGGSFYLIHRPERLVDIVTNMRNYQIEPKRIRMVCPNAKKEPNMVLIKGVKGAKPFLQVLPNLEIYEENGNYTKEVLKIYGKDKKE